MTSFSARIVNRLLPLTGIKTFFSDPSKVQGKIEKLRQKGPDLPSKSFMISISGLKAFGELYAGDLDAKDPRVSPLFGAHDRLPPTQIFTGTADVLWPDSQRFKVALDQAGEQCEYYEYSKMFHVWMLIPIPEGKKAMQQIADFMMTPI